MEKDLAQEPRQVKADQESKRAKTWVAAEEAAVQTTTSRPNNDNRLPHPEVLAAQTKDILSLLILLRLINAAFVRTFFQPDEYFQALEPAWSIAFGDNSGAWLTWEWQHQLRSSLHPAIFGAAYKLAHWLLSLISCPPSFETQLLVALPKAVQAVFAALGDFYTWRLATDVYGRQNNAPWAALWMTVLNPWQWYCSTRTFSNSVETTLTVAALYYWPWELLEDANAFKGVEPLQRKRSVNRLRISLILAAFAVLLRPTNLLIWLGVLTLSLTRLTLDGKSPLKQSSLVILFREILICGTAVLAVSVISDRLYFGFWAFPPYKWLYFNISQSLAVFYGHMPWHYYLSQGIPLLTTTFLPFTIVGLYKSISPYSSASVLQSNILKTLAFTLVSMVTALSIISHKEVRFIYPLLPILHVLGAPYITSFFTTTTTTDAASTATPEEEKKDKPQSPTKTQPSSSMLTLRHKISLANLISINILLAGYLALYHQPAPLSVLDALRRNFERLHPDALSLDNPSGPAVSTDSSSNNTNELFALFLMPCHSTPWRSHLAYPSLRARALTCEPPLHTAPGSVERRDYMDEADRFYARDPENGDKYGLRFMGTELWPWLVGGGGGDGGMAAAGVEGGGGGEEMPRYIVGFEGIEDVLLEFFDQNSEAAGRDDVGGVKLKRVWSAWNGAFNEDWRRRGRMVIWDTGVYPDPDEGLR